MRTVYVNLPTTQSIQDFVDLLSGLTGQFDLISGHYILDARSLLGIFNLDRSRPIQLDVYDDRQENIAALAPFLADSPAASISDNEGQRNAENNIEKEGNDEQ